MSRLSPQRDLNRRDILRGATFAATTVWAGAAKAQASGRSAVVFLSRSGNTRVLAGHLSRQFNAQVSEITPRDPWPADYDEMVAWASRWRESDQMLDLQPLPDASDHDVIFLGFPIWGMSLPAPIRSYLAGTELSGKTVLPFITHGGFGTGSAIEEMRGLAAAASFADEFVLQCDQERDNLDALGGWLDIVAADITR